MALDKVELLLGVAARAVLDIKKIERNRPKRANVMLYTRSRMSGCRTWRISVPLSHPLTGWD